MSAPARQDAGFLAHENAGAIEWTPTENDPVGERVAKFDGFSVLLRCNYKPVRNTAPHRFYVGFESQHAMVGVFLTCDDGWEEAQRVAIPQLREAMKKSALMLDAAFGTEADHG